MANFGIGQGGKYFVFIVFGSYSDKISVYFFTMVFFFYEFFVLILQSYIFIILMAELVGGLHPVISVTDSKFDLTLKQEEGFVSNSGTFVGKYVKLFAIIVLFFIIVVWACIFVIAFCIEIVVFYID